MDQEEFTPKGSFYCYPLLINALFLCKACRDFIGNQDVTYDSDNNATVTVRMCPTCQSLNRGLRNQYRNAVMSSS